MRFPPPPKFRIIINYVNNTFGDLLILKYTARYQKSPSPKAELYTKCNGGTFLVDLKMEKSQPNLQSPISISRDFRRNVYAFLELQFHSVAGRKNQL